MILQWKSYKINLDDFNKYLKENIPSADGITASPEYFEIIEISPFTEEEQSNILNYYNLLDESNG